MTSTATKINSNGELPNEQREILAVIERVGRAGPLTVASELRIPEHWAARQMRELRENGLLDRSTYNFHTLTDKGRASLVAN